jgi:translation elongation factor P/translation initiation factor 5A
VNWKSVEVVPILKSERGMGEEYDISMGVYDLQPGEQMTTSLPVDDEIKDISFDVKEI